MKLKNDTYRDLQVCYGEQRVILLAYEEKEIPYNPNVSEMTVSEYYEKLTLKEKLLGTLLLSFVAVFSGEGFIPMSEYFKFPVRFKTDGGDVTFAESYRLFELCVLQLADEQENGKLIVTKEEIKRQKNRYYSECFALVFIPLIVLLCILAALVVKKSFKNAAVFAVTLALVLAFVFLLIRFSKSNKQTLEELNKKLIENI